MKRKEPSPYCGEKYISKDNKEPLLKDVKERFFDVQQKDESFREQESEVTLESLISAPVVAVSKANATMLSGQVQFILDYCFNRTKFNLVSESDVIFPEKECYEAVMINLVVQKANVQMNDGESKNIQLSSVISIPLLTLLPINSLAIDKMKVDFSMEITSVSSKKDNSENPQSRKAQLSGKLTGDNKSDGTKSTSKGLMVNVEASKLPLPTGLLSIIELYSKI